nr:Dihydrofolate reductase [uncultured bacterium]AIA15275.1 Dihydrofolate reductase [uncultured bacterium]
MKAIIAVNNLGFIGLGKNMLWRSSEDFKHFKALVTDGSYCVVGGNTFDSIAMVGKRCNLLRLSRNPRVGLSLGEIESINEASGIDWCLGGKLTYQVLAPYFTELHISHINDNSIGDVTFPDFKNINPSCKVFNYNFEINKPK